MACGEAFVVKKHAYIELKGLIEDLIQKKIQENEITEVSVYFRDLENGPTLGINEHIKFAPASLLKLPLLLTYLNLAEEQPGFLEKKLRYYKKGSDILEQLIVPTDSIKENTPYTIDTLLKYLISYSDNKAYFVLLQYLKQIFPDENVVEETLQDLGIIAPEDLWEETITVKSYASIFVQLYNSSFFQKKETSEKALALLAESDFHKGIEAGLPAGIKVAHKFGERSFEGSDLKQFHDCGIVYSPQNPYLLCVMTRGYDFEKLPGIISEISKMVYEEFDSRRIR